VLLAESELYRGAFKGVRWFLFVFVPKESVGGVWNFSTSQLAFGGSPSARLGAPILPALRVKDLRGGRDPVSWAVVSTSR
jgi:hypothetical protein